MKRTLFGATLLACAVLTPCVARADEPQAAPTPPAPSAPANAEATPQLPAPSTETTPTPNAAETHDAPATPPDAKAADRERVRSFLAQRLRFDRHSEETYEG